MTFYLFLLVLATVLKLVLTQSCGINPQSISYSNQSFDTGTHPIDCEVENVSGRVYMHCSNTVLTDGYRGPANFNEGDTRPYYIWDKPQKQRLLFTFPRTISLTSIILYYYHSINYALPKVRFFPIGDDFQIWDQVPNDVLSTTIGPVGSSQYMGKASIAVNLTASISKLLMLVEMHKSYGLALSEIEFCINGKCLSH